MSDETKSIEALEAQMTAITDTHRNIAGLIEKVSRIQAELATAGFQEFSDGLSAPFSDLSNVAEKLQKLLHDAEIERNHMRTEK
jgi:hypothetical protein